MREYHGWVGLLRADMRAVAASLGTPRRAASLKAALEIGRRLMVTGYEGRFQVKSPADVAQLFIVEMMALDQEELWVAALDTKNRLIKIAKVYRGSVITAMIRVGEAGRPKIRFHDLRHTAATLMLTDGVPLVTVSKILGHSSPAVTANVYAHGLDEAKSQAIAGLSQQLKKGE